MQISQVQQMQKVTNVVIYTASQKTSYLLTVHNFVKS